MSVPPIGWSVIGSSGDRLFTADLDAAGREVARSAVSLDAVAHLVAGAGEQRRWVWGDTAEWYPRLLADGVRVARCHDLRLCHAILRDSAMAPVGAASLREHPQWDAPAAEPVTMPVSEVLFELAEGSRRASVPRGIDAAIAELARQLAAIDGSDDPNRLRLLCSAESAGALIAAELHAAGVPWDADEHDRLLTAELGGHPPPGGLPPRLAALADQVRELLGDAELGLESQPKLLRALHRVGVFASSTSRWELARYEHPVVAPLIEYRRLSRLLSANGWAWLHEWVAGGRFRPVYVPAGVVTGRWAAAGGGALQIPRQLRSAVRADPGWKLVIADAAQLEPRVLAAIANDLELARAAHGRDLYRGVVESGAVTTRAEAKVAMLGAMYGATTGESGRLLPGLRRAYPRAMRFVDEAARVGEIGGRVTTWLGRTSPPPSGEWRQLQASAGEFDASGAEEARARRRARDRGRFTRNFVVQGSAAEWALAWLADLRARLWALPPMDVDTAASSSGPLFERRPHLAYFLHDEIIVHTPAAYAELVANAVRESADAASRLLFGAFPIDFSLEVKIAETGAKD